jgi:hypothetical protein
VQGPVGKKGAVSLRFPAGPVGSDIASRQKVVRRSRGLWLPLLVALSTLISAAAQGQDDDHQHHHENAAPGWNWTADANLFFGFNDQERKLTPFQAWESQNWWMLAGDRHAGTGQVTFIGMASLEPFTVAPQGSPQLFQTGESYKGTPIVNFQHQHDLVMALGVTYRLPAGRLTYIAGADLVGSPTLGPVVFMHRESARDNPQVPLTHHYLDSTHISYGVVRGGVGLGAFVFEASGFRGAEPDENRLNIERPQIDSWAARVRWSQGPWSGQFSGGHLKQPEWFEPYDITRITASLSYDGVVKSRPLAVTVAWGGNREFNGFNGNNDGYLGEGRLRITGTSTFYGRVEGADKELFGLGAHPRGLSHRHAYSRLYAFTAGYIRDLPILKSSRIGVGGDITTYWMAEELRVFYDSSRSYHVFLRWRPVVAAPHAHF